MLEAALRRHRDGDLVGGDEDRLAELPVPGAVLLLDALEGGELKLGPWTKAETLATSPPGLRLTASPMVRVAT